MAAEKQSYLKEAASLLGKTLPILGLNALVYFVFFAVSVIWFTFWTALAVAAATFVHAFVGIFLFLIALGATGWIWRLARRYLLYLVKGAHIAAMTEIMCGREVPGGLEQIKYGQRIIKKYFRDVSILFALDIIIKATVRALTGTVVRIMSFLPLPGSAKKLVDIIRQIINRSLSYMDAAILSYAIRQRRENVWGSARHGILLYAQSYKGILLSSAKLWVIGKVFDLLVFGILLVPFVGLTALLDFGWGGIIFVAGLIMAAIGARLVELAFYEPYALAYVMVTYHRETEGVEPNPEWDQKLQNVSKKFRELVKKDEEFVPSGDFDAEGGQQLPPGQQGGQIPQPQAEQTVPH